MRRLDIFIIWQHGLKNLYAILDIIKEFENGAFNLLRCEFYTNNKPMGEFIKDIYTCDTVPVEHLEGKTKYLLDTGSKIMVLVAENKSPEESLVGDGVFRHIQCKKVMRLKNLIRDRFNERRGNSRTENHVIHATDYEIQAKYLLNLFKMGDIGEYYNNRNPPFYAPWYLKINTYTMSNYNVNDLMVYLQCERVVNIKDTPHVAALTGNESEYTKYYDKYFGISLLEYKRVADLKLLFNVYSPDYVVDNKSFPVIISASGQISDGVHRAACAYVKGIKNIPVVIHD